MTARRLADHIAFLLRSKRNQASKNMEPATMDKKLALYRATQSILAKRQEFYGSIAESDKFKALGAKIYPYDILSANMDPMFDLFETSHFMDIFNSDKIATVCDLGCANGDLALSFALAGYKTTAIDFSYEHDQAPFVTSQVAERHGLNVAVADMSVDQHFDMHSIQRSLIEAPQGILPLNNAFDLTVCFGLLYHLKNPFAFLESCAKVTKYLALGTHIFTHLPNFTVRLSEDPVAYLVDAGELNNDPTNFWIFSDKALSRLILRCGFEILGKISVANNPQNLALPNDPQIGIRGLYMLRSKRAG